MSSKVVRRSPKSPSVSLEDAIEKAIVLYNKENLYPIANDVAAQGLGYTNYANGAAGTMFSTLKLFGLLEVPKRGLIAVSKDIREFCLNPDENIKNQLLQKWLHMPQVYNAIFEKYDESLPSDASLTHFLVSELNFRDAETAAQSIKKFKDSLMFVRSKASPDEVLVENELDELEPIQPIQPVQPVQHQNLPEHVVPEGFDRIPIRLSKGRKAWIEIPEPFLEKDKKIMKAQIDLIITEDGD